MKCFDNIIKTMIKNCTDHLLDPLQFVLWSGRRVKDTVAILINETLCHLEEAKTHAKVLYLDMSSAFNTLTWHWCNGCMLCWCGDPNSFESISPSLVWRLFPLAHPKDASSSSSPLLFILYTNDCRSIRPNRYFFYIIIWHSLTQSVV